MKDISIEIMTIATNDYVKFLPKFFKTLKYFMPGVKKNVRVFTNKYRDDFSYILENNDVNKLDVVRIFDLYYPSINLNKFNYVEQIEPSESDYVFFFDADTYFKEVPAYDWEGLLNRMDDGEILVTKHMYYNILEGAKWENGSVMNKEYQLYYCYNNMTDREPEYSAFISDFEYTYIIVSFFAAKRDKMYELCKRIGELARMDLHRDKGYHIPLYPEESYLNKLVYNFEKGYDDTLHFDVRQYADMANVPTGNNNDTFIYQKNFNSNFKTGRQ